MKKSCIIGVAIMLSLLVGCGNSEPDSAAVTSVDFSAPAEQAPAAAAVSAVTTAGTQPKTSEAADTTAVTAAETTAAAAQTEAPAAESSPEAAAVPEETAAEAEEPELTEEAAAALEVFTGILIDEDCSDFEDPPKHDLPCMLMDSCRASGYGIDIQQPDGSWTFYMFDKKGQELALDYLLHTDRMDGLYVTVTGSLEDNTIYVDKLEEK